jgi:hypothetical protein
MGSYCAANQEELKAQQKSKNVLRMLNIEFLKNGLEK